MKRYGKDNPNWRGGRSVTSHGYVLVRVGKGHHLADVRGYAYEHRLVAEEKVGRRLQSGEMVHHINGERTDNCPDNLMVAENSAKHLVHHRKHADRRLPDETNPIVKCACGCSDEFAQFDKYGRPRRFINGHNARGIGGRL